MLIIVFHRNSWKILNGDLLFQGDDADCMYFIEDGECRVTVTNKVIQCIL